MTEETQLTVQPAETPAVTGGVLARLDSAETMGRIAKLLSTSKIVPQLFKQDAGACMLALNMAQNVKCDPYQLMQNMYEVHGRIGISGQFCVALLKANPEYTNVSYVNLNGIDYTDGVRVVALTTKGETIEGTAITPEIVKQEGWDKNSKWRTMAEQMYKYRAAAFFVRANCPNLLFGMQTTDELKDVEMQERRRYAPTPAKQQQGTQPAAPAMRNVTPSHDTATEPDSADLFGDAETYNPEPAEAYRD